MVAIGVDQSFSHSDFYEEICLGKARSYTTCLVIFTINNSINTFLKNPWYPPRRASLTTVQCPWPICVRKNPSARKSLHQFSEVLYVKPKNVVCGLGAAISKCKAFR